MIENALAAEKDVDCMTDLSMSGVYTGKKIGFPPCTPQACMELSLIHIWAVELLQSNFDNVPLALDTSNVAAIEAGISVYNRSKGKPIVNSADAAGRIGYVDVEGIQYRHGLYHVRGSRNSGFFPDTDTFFRQG